MTLYEIDGRLQTALAEARDTAMENDGVIPETMAAALYGIEIEKEEKAIQCVLAYKNLMAESTAIENEMATLSKRNTAILTQAAWLEGYVEHLMPWWKYSGPKCQVSFRKSEVVNIIDESKIPDEYMRLIPEKITPASKAPDKAAIKKAGGVPGTEIIVRQNIKIK